MVRPHLIVNTKTEPGNSSRICLKDMFEQVTRGIWRLFIAAELHITSVNIVGDEISHCLQSCTCVYTLSRTFIFQLCKTSRDSDDNYLSYNLEFLIVCNDFKALQVSFLPLKRTDRDIDQSFPTTANQLCHTKTVNIYKIHFKMFQHINNILLFPQYRDSQSVRIIAVRELFAFSVCYITLSTATSWLKILEHYYWRSTTWNSNPLLYWHSCQVIVDSLQSQTTAIVVNSNLVTFRLFSLEQNNTKHTFDFCSAGFYKVTNRIGSIEGKKFHRKPLRPSSFLWWWISRLRRTISWELFHLLQGYLSAFHE